MHFFKRLSALCLFNFSFAKVRARSLDFTGFTHSRGPGNTTIRYKAVSPEICELHPGIKSYSGYVDISEDAHMFFWFFEARNGDPSAAPLTAWISGGPGDSSMSELFTEHGPCRVHPDGESIQYNPFSWNNYSNVIYIDQPVQVGFSYTELVPAYVDGTSGDILELEDGENCPEDAEICGNFSRPDTSSTANSTTAAAHNFWLTLQGFMATFPQYSKKGFHLTSESYGGHYVPVFSKYIQEQNANIGDIPGALSIDLKSILIGNGWFSGTIQTASYYNFGFESGNTYDMPPLNDSIKKAVHDAYYLEGQCADMYEACRETGTDEACMTAESFCLDNVQEPWIRETARDNNDIRQLEPSPFPNTFYQDYLQLPEVLEAIGAQQTFFQKNPTVGDAFRSTGDDSREFGILDIIKDLLDHNIRVTLYAGDADYECNWLGVEAVADAIGVPDHCDGEAGYTDVMTPDNVVHGQVRQSGGFSFVRVYEAGHAVGAFQPLVQQTIFARTLAGTDLACGEVQACAEYCSVGSPKSTYREGNATVQYLIWPGSSTYDYISNLPTLEDFQPVWEGQ